MIRLIIYYAQKILSLTSTIITLTITITITIILHAYIDITTRSRYLSSDLELPKDNLKSLEELA